MIRLVVGGGVTALRLITGLRLASTAPTKVQQGRKVQQGGKGSQGKGQSAPPKAKSADATQSQQGPARQPANQAISMKLKSVAFRAVLPSMIANSDPEKHSKDDVSKIYGLGSEIQSFMPEGFAGDLRSLLKPRDKWRRNDGWFQTMKVPSEAHLLIRKETIGIIDRLKAAQESKKLNEENGILLEGVGGCGKSMVLNHLVHWARKSEWLVVFIPEGSKLVKSGKFFEWTTDFRVLQLDAGTEILQNMMQSSEKKLKQVTVKGPPLPEPFNECKTLHDIVSLGLEERDVCVQAVVFAMEELALATEFPVLVAVDEMNLVCGKTEFLDITNPSRPRLHFSKLVLASLFSSVESKHMKNGIVVAATTRQYGKIENSPVEGVDKERVLEIPPFNRHEIEVLLRLYSDMGHTCSPLPEEDIPSYATLAKSDVDGRGRLVHRMAAMLG